MKPQPPDAQSVWAWLWRWRHGRWQGERRETSWGADGAPGASVFDEQRAESGRSASSVDDAGRCDESRCPESPAPSGITPYAATEGWRHLASAPDVVFGVAQGDTLHIVGPFARVTPAGSRVLPLLAGRGDAFRIARRGDWLLVWPEDPPGAAYLLDGRDGSVRPLGRVAAPPVFVE